VLENNLTFLVEKKITKHRNLYCGQNVGEGGVFECELMELVPTTAGIQRKLIINLMNIVTVDHVCH